MLASNHFRISTTCKQTNCSLGRHQCKLMYTDAVWKLLTMIVSANARTRFNVLQLTHPLFSCFFLHFSKNLQKCSWWSAHIRVVNHDQVVLDYTKRTIDQFCSEINVTVYWQCILTHFDWDVLCVFIVVFVQKSTFMVWRWKN